MGAKIRLRNTVAGPYLDADDLPAEGDIVDTLLETAFSFDVPNAEFNGTTVKSLTLEAAIQEAFDAVLAAAGS